MTPADFEESPHIGPDHQLPEHAEGSGGSKSVKVIVWIAILLIFGAAYYLIEHHKTVPTTPAGGGRRGAAGGTVVLTTATATQGDIGVYVNAIGTVTPVYTANITAQVSGPVTAVHFKEGQLVRKGTPLIEIDLAPVPGNAGAGAGNAGARPGDPGEGRDGCGAVSPSVGEERDPEANAGRSGKTGDDGQGAP